MMLSHCPVCQNRDIEVLVEFPHCVTSDSAPIAAAVHNVFCRGCGLVFNASGVRGQEREFYAHAYDLLADSAEAEFTYETDQGQRGINAEMIDFLRRSGVANGRGRMLEIGAGKGVFLRHFRRAFGDWTLAAVEPSRNARAFLGKLVPGLAVHEGALETSPFLNDRFDLVVSIGVLEHVPDPIAFMGRVRACLADDGAVFLSVPNFDMNPSDLLTFDHLSRFTGETVSDICRRSGLTVIDIIAPGRIPMWVLARPAPGEGEAGKIDTGKLRRRAGAAVTWVNQAMEVYARLAAEARRPGRRVGIYGTGIAAIAATSLGRLRVEEIACFFDDNPHLQGGQRLGRTVFGLDKLAGQGITDLCFSANPCYLGRMEERAQAASDGRLRLWPLPHLSIS